MGKLSMPSQVHCNWDAKGNRGESNCEDIGKDKSDVATSPEMPGQLLEVRRVKELVPP